MCIQVVGCVILCPFRLKNSLLDKDQDKGVIRLGSQAR